MECHAFYFRSPSSILLVGPSSCGKSWLVDKILEEKATLFKECPPNVHYCYGIWQDQFKNLAKKGIRMHEGIPDTDQLHQWFGKQKGGILVLDDLMAEGSNDKRVLDLFTKDSHHRNVTVLYLCQDMFPPGKYAKTISRNAHYIVAFKNPRDQLGVRNLALQSFPSDWEDVLQVYRESTKRPYGYLLFDLHPSSSDDERLKSNILKGEGYTTVYKRRPW